MSFANLQAGIIEEVKAQKDRLFLWIPIAFGVGITAYFMLPFEPLLWPMAIILGVLFGFGLKLHHRQNHSNGWFLSYLAGVAMILMAGGFISAQIGTMRVGTKILEKPMKFAAIEADVEHVEPMGAKRGSRVLLSNVHIENLSPEVAPKKIRITFRKDEGIKAGQHISTLANLSSPSTAVYPGAYDFRRYLFFDSIGAVGFSYKPATILNQTNNIVFFENIRTHINDTINEKAGAVSAGIMTALITGARGEIANEDNDAMRASGLYHLLSISGSHVCMVAGVLFFFLRFFMATIPWLALHWPIKKIAAMVALIGAGFYVFLAGAEVPAQRALMMTALAMVAIMLDRTPLSLRLIAFSAMLVLIIAPYSLVGVSFQMSFAAVAALICFFDYIRVWWMKVYSSGGWLRKGCMYLIAIMLTSLIAGSVTGLFSLYHFQSFAVYGVLSNMMAVPLTAFVIMPAAIVAMIFMPFGLDAWPLKIMEWGVLKMLVIAHWTAGFDGAVIHTSQWPQVTFCFIVTGLVLFLLWQGWRGKAIALCIIVVGLVLTPTMRVPDVIVSSTGKLIGVYDGGVLYVSSTRKEKFSSENWNRLLGHDDVKPISFYDETSPVRCDDYACRWEKGMVKFSFMKGRHAMEEECAWASVLISDIPVPKGMCPQNVRVFDLYDFRYRNAHAFYVSQDNIDVRTVGDNTGKRPWR